MNNLAMLPNPSTPRESFYEAKYRDRQRNSLSNVSFYKQTSAGNGASRFLGTKRGADNRNIAPELVKKGGMKVVLRYLSWQEYPEPISMMELQSPSRALLISLWNFIFKRIDKSVEIDSSNANEEVPRIFKELGYPLTITKSSMVAPGTGQQWSHHLAALCWLCELLIYETEALPGIAEGADIRNYEELSSSALSALHGSQLSQHTLEKTDGAASASAACLNKIVAKNYILCMTGREHKDNIKNAVLSQLEADAEAMRNSHEKKTAEMKSLQSNIQQMQQVLDEHEQCGSNCESLENESKQLTDLTIEAEQQIPIITSHVDSIKQTIRLKRKEFEEQNAIAKQLKETVAKQSMNKEEYRRLSLSVEENYETLERHKMALEATKSERTEANSQKNEAAKELQSLCAQVNRKLSETVTLAKRVKGPSLDLWNKMKIFKFTADANSVDLMLNLNWKEQKKRLLSAYKMDEELLQKLNVEANLLEAQNIRKKIESLNQKLESKRMEEIEAKQNLAELDKSKTTLIKDLQTQLNTMEQEAENNKEKFNDRYADGQKRLAALQSDIEDEKQHHLKECAERWKYIQDICKNLYKAKETSRQTILKIADEQASHFHKMQTVLVSHTFAENS